MFARDMLLGSSRSSRFLAALIAALVISISTSSCSAPEPTDTPEQMPAEEPLAGEQDQDPAHPSDRGQPQGQGQENLRQQRARTLVSQYLAQAQRLRELGRLEEAKLALLQARDLVPQDPEIMSMLNAVNAELGIRAGGVQTFGEQQERLQEIREQAARSEVAARLAQARQLMAAGNNQAAIQELRTALLHIEVGRSVDWGTLETEARELLGQAEQARDAAERRERTAAEQETIELLRREEELQRAQRQAKVEGLIATASRAFQNRQFRLAEELAFEALQTDPQSGLARELHNAAIKAVRETRTDDYYREKARQIARMTEEMEQQRIPQTDLIRIDPATWSRALARQPGVQTEAAVDPEDEAVRERVRKEVVGRFSFTEETGDYREVKKLIQTVTDIPIVITPEAQQVITDEGLVLRMDLVSPITVANLLDLMVARSENLAWTVRNGVVELTSRAKAGGRNVWRSHDIRDLVFPIANFIPPQIRDIPVGESAAAGGKRTGGEAEEKLMYVEPDQLVATLKDATDPKYWETEGVNMEPVEGGYLLVTANADMQQRIAQVLEDLRRFATAVVTIESKFLSINRNFLQQLGVDFRGLGGSGSKGDVASLDDVTNRLDDNASRGLDNAGTGDPASNPIAGMFFNDGGDGDVRGRTENFFENPLGRSLSTIGGATASWSYLGDVQLNMILRAVEKQEDIQLVNSQVLTVLNNERANVAVLNQTSYVKDYEVEVAQAAFIADPKVDVIQDGVVLDVRPTISYDRRHIVLNLQPTVAELQTPIPTFTTSLAGSTLPVTLQLPIMTVRSFATTAVVPDGGSVLIGGLREMRSIERRAEVPVLGKIPLLGFFFKQEGVSDENSSLMVLVRASITDVKDLMDRFQPSVLPRLASRR